MPTRVVSLKQQALIIGGTVAVQVFIATCTYSNYLAYFYSEVDSVTNYQNWLTPSGPIRLRDRDNPFKYTARYGRGETFVHSNFRYGSLLGNC